jgi:shikimate kinase
VLVGLMGAGKSTVGRRLARDLGLDFRDSDNEIQEAAGCSISDIFEIHGEGIFRDLEKRVIKRLLEGSPLVIATGGGAFIQPHIREMISEFGISIWLRAELDVLVERVSRKNTRPLLEKGDKREILSDLMDKRYPVYEQADVIVNSDDGAHEKVVHDIIHALKQFLKTSKAS